MQFVSQITFVLKGSLVVYMYDVTDNSHCKLELEENEAVISKPGAFFQLINQSTSLCKVLYIVSPAYVFEMKNNQVVYDDSIILEEDWVELE